MKNPRSFLLAAALVAALLSTLSPLFAATRRDAATAQVTASRLRLVWQAASLYAEDHGGAVVPAQGDLARTETAWPALVQPYGRLDPSAFFRPGFGDRYEVVNGLGQRVALPWQAVASISLNNNGYSGLTPTLGNRCGGKALGYQLGRRTISSFRDPALRVAFAPTRLAGYSFGWSAFSAIRSFGPSKSARYFDQGLVYDALPDYGGTLPTIRVDGSAGLFTAKDFRLDSVSAAGVPTPNACAWLSGDGGKVWGRYWTAD